MQRSQNSGMSGASVAVEMGETWVSGTGQDRLVAQGLGACVSLCLYDPFARLAAMAHVVLPETLRPTNLRTPATAPCQQAPPPGRCADTAVTHAVGQIVAQGGELGRLRAAIVGGSHIFSHASATPGQQSSVTLSRLEIGPRNTEAIRAALDAVDIPLVAEDVGGHCGRTVTLCVESGDVFVRRVGADERRIGCLGVPVELHERASEGAMYAAR